MIPEKLAIETGVCRSRATRDRCWRVASQNRVQILQKIQKGGDGSENPDPFYMPPGKGWVMKKIGKLLWWNKKGYGVIAVPIEGSKNVERYYLGQTRILKGPAVPQADMKVEFSLQPGMSRPGMLPSAVHAVFIDDSNDSIVEPSAAPLADLLGSTDGVK